MDLRCPEDGNCLALATAEGHAGYRCPKCTGLWLPAALLESMARAYRYDIAPLHAKLATLARGERVLPCPEGHRLSRLEYRTLELDWCADCHGIWFDAGELRRLIDLHPDEAMADAVSKAGGVAALTAADVALGALGLLGIAGG
jgi:Zn-finger nucleic acid-binding protein